MSWTNTFKLTWDSQSPVNPPLIKKKIKADIKEKTESSRTDPYIKVKVQLTIFTTAGSEIITVTVL